MSYNVNLDKIDGVPLNELIDRGYRFNIHLNDENVEFVPDETIDEINEDLVHVQ